MMRAQTIYRHGAGRNPRPGARHAHGAAKRPVRERKHADDRSLHYRKRPEHGRHDGIMTQEMLFSKYAEQYPLTVPQEAVENELQLLILEEKQRIQYETLTGFAVHLSPRRS